MDCNARNKDGTTCGKEATTHFGLFPCCEFHGTVSRSYQTAKSRQSYNEGYKKAKLELEGSSVFFYDNET